MEILNLTSAAIEKVIPLLDKLTAREYDRICAASKQLHREIMYALSNHVADAPAVPEGEK